MQIKRSKYTIFGTHQLPINYQINKYSTLILEFKSNNEDLPVICREKLGVQT
jgi:hypothetical protein